MNKLYKIIFNIARTFAVPGFNFLTAIVGVKFLGESNWGAFVQILLWIYLVVFVVVRCLGLSLNWMCVDVMSCHICCCAVCLGVSMDGVPWWHG